MSLAEFHTIADCRSSRWILAHFDYPNDDCLLWPFARKGGGYVQIARGILVHRLMCEYRNGAPPTPAHHAAHSCERGHDGCVNQRHLDWKTPSENQLDRFQHGPLDEPREKLTLAQVVTIRALKGIETSDLTAARFGVCESNIRLIQAGKTWKTDSKSRPAFSDAEVIRIRSVPQANGVTKAFAAEFGVTTQTIQRIRARQYYRHVLSGAETVDINSVVSPADRS